MSKIKGEYICITGGAGFIGGYLAQELAKYNHVRVLDDLSSGKRSNVPESATLIEGDIRNLAATREAIQGTDIVFHHAGLVNVAQCVEEPRQSQDVNVAGTLSVLEAARLADARVVLASSSSIYGDPQNLPIDEAHPTEPKSPYGLDKLALDHYARLYDELYDLETVALRYFNVYGPGQPADDYGGVIGIFFEQAESGAGLTVHGDGEQTRDFVHVEDVVQANVKAALADTSGRAYNIGTGTELSINDLANHVRNLVETDVDIVHTEAREGDVRRSVADISLAKEKLDFEPTVDITAGLRTVQNAR